MGFNHSREFVTGLVLLVVSAALGGCGASTRIVCLRPRVPSSTDDSHFGVEMLGLRAP
jgi:hypothetical protein